MSVRKIYRSNKIVLDFRCGENFLAMDLTDTGRHCEICSKDIYDFTGMSVEEANRFIYQSQNENICGYFKKKNFAAPVNIDIQVGTNPLLKHAYTALFAIGSLLQSCNTEFEQENDPDLPLTGQINPNDTLAQTDSVESDSTEISMKQSNDEKELKPVHHYSSMDRTYDKYLEDCYVVTRGVDDRTIGYKDRYEVTGGVPLERDPFDTGSPYTVYGNVEVEPEFPGGDAELVNYIYKHLRKRKIKSFGRALVGFTVESNGKITDVVLVDSLDDTTNKEVVRLIKSMPKWEPGKVGDGDVSTRMVLPVHLDPER